MSGFGKTTIFKYCHLILCDETSWPDLTFTYCIALYICGVRIWQYVMSPTSPFFVLFVKNRPKHKWWVQDLPRHITSISGHFCKTNEKTFESIQYYLAIYVFVFKPMDLVLCWLLFYLFCFSIVINAVIKTAEPLNRNESKNANIKGKTLKSHDNANLKGKTQI
jgi:hypothetical protein